MSEQSPDAPNPEGGWHPVGENLEPAERLDLDDLDLISEITHPIRGGIMRRLKDPKTVAELASELDVPVTRLYHHVNRLEGHGLIRVVATRKIAAVIESRYQVTALAYGLSPERLETADRRELAAVLGSLFDVAKLDLVHEVESGGLEDLTALNENWTVSLGEVHLTVERRQELIRRLEALVKELDSDTGEDAQRVTLFIAAFPHRD